MSKTNPSKKIYPRPQQEYSLRTILTTLELQDSPHLGFYLKPPVRGPKDPHRESDERTWGEARQVIQTSHLTDEELLSVPGMADSVWVYMYTTREWIPIFRLVAGQDIHQLVDMEPSRDKYASSDEPRCWWVTPKGFPRQQYYDENYNEPHFDIVDAHKE